MSKEYPQEVRKFILKHLQGTGPAKMAELLNKEFGTDYTRSQLKSYYGNHKLNSGTDGRFEKGHVPANKGKKGYHAPGCEKSWFKNGHISMNHRPVGSERIDNKNGYTLIKIAEPNTWVLKHKYIWEAANGPVPDGYVLTFLDGDKRNISLENLELITMAESLEINRSGLRCGNTELTKIGILIAKIKIAGKKKKKAGKDS
jgi:hypothetical protein